MIKKDFKQIIGKLVQLTYVNQKKVPNTISGRVLFSTFHNIVFIHEDKELFLRHKQIKKVVPLNSEPPQN